MRIVTAIAAGLAFIGSLLAAPPAHAGGDTDTTKSTKAKQGGSDKSSETSEETDYDSNKALEAIRARNAAATHLHVEGGPTSSKISLGALLGYGFKDGVRLGFGARVGYTLPAKVHLGATFLYHLGSSVGTPYGDASTHLYYFGLEGGYDIAVSPVVIRPYLGLGAAVGVASTPAMPDLGAAANTSSTVKIGFWPGVTAMYPIAGRFYAGLDTRFLIVSDFNAFSLFATGGVLL